MFGFIRLLWIAIGAIPLIIAFVRGKDASEEEQKRLLKRGGIFLGVFIAILILARIGTFLYTELGWFASLGASERFWSEFGTRLLLGGIGLVLGFLIAWPLFVRLWRRLEGPTGALTPPILGLGIGIYLAIAGNGLWETVLIYLNRAPTEAADPILGLSHSFYLFVYPILDALLGIAITLIFFLLIGGFFIALARQQFRAAQERNASVLLPAMVQGYRYFLGVGAALFVGIAASQLLQIPEFLLNRSGVVFGANWLDVTVRMPAQVVAALVYLAIAALLTLSAFSPRTGRRIFAIRLLEEKALEREEESSAMPEGRERVQQPREGSPSVQVSLKSAIVPVVAVAILVVAQGLLPGLIKPFVLNPNEITLERPYIVHNIEGTQAAYGLRGEGVTQTSYQVGQDISPEILEQNPSTLNNIRLWDPAALKDNLEQRQEIRLYYQFHDVDIDRYTIDGEYTQLMLSVRELEKSALSPGSNTWVARHLQYTHGFGLVALPVHTFLPQGRPELLVRNIPPETNTPRLELSQPRVYYGERTADHVYVNTTQQEFDYPAGEENVFYTYDGEGGVRLGGLLRRVLYAARYDGENQLFSNYITADSRIMFRRSLRERARALAPFLLYDQDPYPVVTEEGEIKYILDAYTTARTYPYSERYEGSLGQFGGSNYVRNSVKVVIDAFDGTVTFYVIDEEDPVLRTYRNIFPELFIPISEMPGTMREHIRYPVDLIALQAEMYRVYHMDDPTAFYQREDVWEFATERYRANFQRVKPYYALINMPDGEGVEFVVMLPFTPANKNVIHAWMAGRSDQPHYGELTTYTFPKGTEVLGPRQIEARIDQNTEMSRALSLWGQRGSSVIRGNLLAIPLFDDNELYMLFAEPIFLQAENASLPEIKRIVLADQDTVVWAPTFDEAVRELVGLAPQDVEVAVEAGRAAAAAPAAAPGEMQPALQELSETFDRFRSQLSNGNFGEAGSTLEELSSQIEELAGSRAGGSPDGDAAENGLEERPRASWDCLLRRARGDRTVASRSHSWKRSFITVSGGPSRTSNVAPRSARSRSTKEEERITFRLRCVATIVIIASSSPLFSRDRSICAPSSEAILSRMELRISPVSWQRGRTLVVVMVRDSRRRVMGTLDRSLS